jgi:GNAT superfamily N-acetyltransferase
VLEPDSELTIRLVMASDAALVRELMLTGFAQFQDVLDPPSGAFRETVEDVAAAIGRGGAAVAWLGETPVGSVRFEPEGSWLYIGRLAVIPEARRRGVAQALMLAAEAQAPRFGVLEAQLSMREVLPGNRALFEKLEYDVIAIEPHPRNPAQNTLRLRKMLVQSDLQIG